MPTHNTGKHDEKDRSSVGFEPEKIVQPLLSVKRHRATKDYSDFAKLCEPDARLKTFEKIQAKHLAKQKLRLHVMFI